MLSSWGTAVESSPAYDELDRLLLEAVDQTIVENLAYLLRYHELWARSYAQYIARRSNDLVLLRQLASDLYRRLGDKTVPAHWLSEDFEPIESAIDDAFEGLGWR